MEGLMIRVVHALTLLLGDDRFRVREAGQSLILFLALFVNVRPYLAGSHPDPEVRRRLQVIRSLLPAEVVGGTWWGSSGVLAFYPDHSGVFRGDGGIRLQLSWYDNPSGRLEVIYSSGRRERYVYRGTSLVEEEWGITLYRENGR
jgi:hypothetical protein